MDIYFFTYYEVGRNKRPLFYLYGTKRWICLIK